MAVYGIQLFSGGGVVMLDSSNIGLSWGMGSGGSISIAYGSEPNRYSQVEYLIHNTPAVSGLRQELYKNTPRTFENDVFISLHPTIWGNPNHWDPPNGIRFWNYSIDVKYSGSHISSASATMGSLHAVGLNNNLA